jgi:aryl-alcohol dehydrogenase-like predicted oxidoreductase
MSEFKEEKKTYYQRNKERILAYQNQYNLLNKEKLKEYRKIYHSNNYIGVPKTNTIDKKKYHREYNRKYRENNPDKISEIKIRYYQRLKAKKEEEEQEQEQDQ